jgi:hypothetical protein
MPIGPNQFAVAQSNVQMTSAVVGHVQQQQAYT